jgi:alanine dehydrogenase
MPANVTTLYSTPMMVRRQAAQADLVIGAVLIPGAKAPGLLRRPDLKEMKNGAVIVDVSIDQGGCIETSRPTTHSDPTYEVDGVVHYCVTNMPGAVGRTSTYALTNATLQYVRLLARHGTAAAVRKIPALRDGANVLHGNVTHPGVAEAFGLDCVAPEQLLTAAV